MSIGFPLESYQKHLGDCTASADPDGTVRVQSGVSLDESLFQSWKDSLPLAGPSESDRIVSGDRIQVYRESYALLTQVFELTVNVQKDYKSIPGEDIKRDCLELVRSVLHANDAKEDSLRLSFIRKAQEYDEDII